MIIDYWMLLAVMQSDEEDISRADKPWSDPRTETHNIHHKPLPTWVVLDVPQTPHMLLSPFHMSKRHFCPTPSSSALRWASGRALLGVLSEFV